MSGYRCMLRAALVGLLALAMVGAPVATAGVFAPLHPVSLAPAGDPDPSGSFDPSRNPWDPPPAPVETPRRPPTLRFLPVLEYHHILPAAEIRKRAEFTTNPYIVSVEVFSHQLAALQRTGYHTIDTVELERYYHGGPPLPAHPILITFDDGYASFYQYAFPALKERRMKATLFTIVATVTEKPTPYSPQKLTYVSWPELREMVDSGWVDVQSHTYDLHSQAPSGYSQLVAVPAGRARSDLLQAKQTLEAHLGNEVVAVAYPHGHYSTEVLGAVRETGYTFGFAGHRSILVDDPLALRRIIVKPNTEF